MGQPATGLKSLADLGLDMFDPQAIARPHQFYARLREEAPVVWSEQTQSWVLTRYEDVRRGLRDHFLFSSERPDQALLRGRSDIPLERVEPRGTKNMLAADRPDHTRLRKLLAMDFTPKKIIRMQPRIEEICREVLQGVADEGDYDVVTGLAEPLPVKIIAELLGIPSELHSQFKQWSDASITPVPPDASDASIHARNGLISEFREYLQAQIEERHDNPTDDFIGRLVAAHDEDSKLSDAEVLGAVNLLLLAGNETTTNLISNATLAMSRFPERQTELREHPELMETAVEEFLRYDGSVQFTSRILTEPAEFQGHTIDAGQSVLLVLASANRDPNVFDHPDELDFHRPKDKHLGFGDWIHICLGQFLARIETRAALSALIEEFGEFELATAEADVPYRPNFNLRGPSHLLIRRCA
jgi:cytochrome P450